VLPGKKLGKDLLPDDIPLVYVEERGKEVLVKADISKYKIALPSEGVFVGLEYLGEVTNKTDKTIIKTETSFGIWHIYTTEPTPDDITYSKWKRKLEDDLPKTEPWLCLFGIEVVR
jgi:hypothetical protein